MSKERFNPNYHTQEDHVKRNIEKAKYHKAMKENVKYKVSPININGVTYSSIIEASKTIGCSLPTLRKYAKKLSESKRSEIEEDVMIKKTLVFKKVK